MPNSKRSSRSPRSPSQMPRGTRYKSRSMGASLYSRSRTRHRIRKGGSVSNQNMYITNRLSTEPNLDSSYQQVGIIHFTEMSASNVVRRFATDLANIFGKKGFEGEVYDKARTAGLEKLEAKLEGSQKICNLRIDFEHNVDTIIIHMYGSLYEKRKDLGNQGQLPAMPGPSESVGSMQSSPSDSMGSVPVQMPGQSDSMGPVKPVQNSFF